MRAATTAREARMQDDPKASKRWKAGPSTLTRGTLLSALRLSRPTRALSSEGQAQDAQQLLRASVVVSSETDNCELITVNFCSNGSARARI